MGGIGIERDVMQFYAVIKVYLFWVTHKMLVLQLLAPLDPGARVFRSGRELSGVFVFVVLL